MKILNIQNGVTTSATEAIENAIRQNAFYNNIRKGGPAFDPNDRSEKTKTFNRVHRSFLLRTNFGTVQVLTSYKETLNDLIYSFKVFVNDQRCEEPINYLKKLIKL
jgi:hypothetical protein